MTNKEIIEYLKNNTKFYEPVNREYFRILEAEIEELEKYRKILNKPIKEMVKELNVLEIFKNCRMLQLRYVDCEGKTYPMLNKYDDKAEEKAYLIYLTDSQIEALKEVRKNDRTKENS